MTGSEGAPGDEAVDVLRWRLAGLPGRLTEASYLTAGNASQFRVVVDLIAQAQTQRLTGVSRQELPELVRAHLERARPATAADLLADLLDSLDARLRQLVAVGHLRGVAGRGPVR